LKKVRVDTKGRLDLGIIAIGNDALAWDAILRNASVDAINAGW
jgi:hypothetical protein